MVRLQNSKVHGRSGLRAGLAVCLAAAGCARCNGSSPHVVGSFEGGNVTVEELQREAARLPPVLRARFETAAGRRELVSALIDRKLLALEARRRKLTEDPEVRRQVADLEEKLSIQALLADEERRAGPPSDAEMRAFYEAKKGELAQSGRVRVRRVLAAVGENAPRSDRDRARTRAERFAARLRAGESAEKVAADGEGAETRQGGDLGLLAEKGDQDPAQEKAIAALTAPGQWSPVVAVREGFAVLQLVERRPARMPSFEEARAEVANRLTPLRKRKQFDELMARLRKGAGVTIPAREGEGP